MKTICLRFVALIVIMLFASPILLSQVLIGDDSDTPHPSAALEIRSDSGGLLIPTVVLSLSGSDVVAPDIQSPSDGLMVFHDGLLSDGSSSGLPRGLWYYDEVAAGTGKWLIYSRSGSIYSSNLDNFGEMYEANAIGGGTSITINNVYSKPWKSASQGVLGPGFGFLNNQTVLSETGTSVIADQLIINTSKAYYTVDISSTLQTLTSANLLTGQLFVNNVAEPGVFFRHAFQTASEYVNCAATGIVVLDQFDKIDIRFKTNTATETIVIEHLNIKLTKIGDF